MATAKKTAKAGAKSAPSKSSAKSSGAVGRSAAKSAAKSVASKSAAKGAAKSASKSVAKSAAKSAAKGAAKTATKRAANPAFMKPLQPDAQLAAVVGSDPMPRTQVVAKVWEYIKKNGLQQSRNINADAKLRPIFGKEQITMFEMMKLVNAHLGEAR